MKHPFAKPTAQPRAQELNDQDTEIVGGGLRSTTPPIVTTLAIGEEGGIPPGGPIYTTMAIGEEGGSGSSNF